MGNLLISAESGFGLGSRRASVGFGHSRALPGTAPSCPHNSILGRFISSPLHFSLVSLPQRGFLTRQAAPARGTAAQEKDAKKAAVCPSVCSENPGKRAAGEQRQGLARPAVARGTLGHSPLCAVVVEMPYLTWRQRFLGVGAANNRFMEVFFSTFQLRGWRFGGFLFVVRLVPSCWVSTYLCAAGNMYGHFH